METPDGAKPMRKVTRPNHGVENPLPAPNPERAEEIRQMVLAHIADQRELLRKLRRKMH
ncbi:hypothetical protein [Bradyrhizobium sp. 192]|uniref:hypothetical protein n=1 Tax=Bradyrhizobium sp. 192 TaxID=2782660 RepID=UPI0020000AAB|nr:hypothetical protein [Bradyrhizobium sp. 192]UPJ61939.1 hypothetical protein IVB24_27775 [Bradyrhizobium sp. 192]